MFNFTVNQGNEDLIRIKATIDRYSTPYILVKFTRLSDAKDVWQWKQPREAMETLFKH